MRQVFRSASHPVPRVLRALSAGIIVALALVHVFPDAVEDFDKLVPLMNPDYPYNAAGWSLCQSSRATNGASSRRRAHASRLVSPLVG